LNRLVIGATDQLFRLTSQGLGQNGQLRVV